MEDLVDSGQEVSVFMTLTATYKIRIHDMIEHGSEVLKMSVKIATPHVYVIDITSTYLPKQA
ncbi:hypothetical protein RvY_17358 [Ramazzottius varieornatus]|uniref:Uncharacterized protein n=1 Tax=Ramazzottius varieornatus TaxID=947166 RepID=A0A1D1W427_RAMVA|nr:hypothetical protein RvY_17358 [Ramazzottius varieornatus]